MKIIDKVGLPEVAEFVEKQISPFDLSKVEWFKLLPLPKRPWTYRCQYPKRVAPRARKFVHQYRLSASVRPTGPFPYNEWIAIGTRTVNAAGGWEYICEDVVFADGDELLVFAAGACAFRFLRHSRQVPGRNTDPGANRFGLEWLSAWRQQHAPIIRRRDAVLATRRKYDKGGD